MVKGREWSLLSLLLFHFFSTYRAIYASQVTVVLFLHPCALVFIDNRIWEIQVCLLQKIEVFLMADFVSIPYL